MDRPVKYFKMIYSFLQVGHVTMKESDYPIFLIECDYYGVELTDNDCEACVCMKKDGSVSILTRAQYDNYKKKKCTIEIVDA